MGILLIIILAFGLVLWLGFGGIASRATVKHVESQIHLPGRLAIEVGKDFAHQQSRVWMLWFEDAIIRYTAADRAWWTAYKRSSGRRRKNMAERRLALQKDIGEFIDPVECLRQLSKIAHQCLDECKLGRRPEPDAASPTSSDHT